MQKTLKRWIIGKPQDPLCTKSRKGLALIAFYAWIGLGSDGLSSANYGPEEAFRALGQYPMLGMFLAIAIMVTVFIIAGAYNQVIELFPTGGGGYKVANQLLHPFAGLVAGVALLLDYVLTIAISVAAASDALFSLLPNNWWHYRIICDIAIVLILMILNLRGLKESIKIIMPIFLGFVITHIIVLSMGFFMHANQVPAMFHNIISQSHKAVHDLGWMATLLLMVKAYSLGAGTYTGLEAVSNNVNVLAEPRVKTGKLTMLYIALSLSVMAGGITFMYMLWHIGPSAGQTYNASLFTQILSGVPHSNLMVSILMLFEAGILMLGANTGFLGGPAVFANMAMDNWVPRQFRNLSSRLVKQNGIIAMAVISIAVLLLTDGHVKFLVILYSTSVFLTFSLSLFGLVKHWISSRKTMPFKKWIKKLTISLLGFIICTSILGVIVTQKFFDGGWLALLMIGSLIILFAYIKNHYKKFSKQIGHVDNLLTLKKLENLKTKPKFDASENTAVVFVNENAGLGAHTLLWINRLFPNHFKNYVFVQVGAVDIESFKGEKSLKQMRNKVSKNLRYFVKYANNMNAAAESYSDFGMNTTEKLYELSIKISEKYPKAIFFSSKIILTKSKILGSLLHNKASSQLQDKLHSHGRQMILLPIKIRL